MWNQPAAAVLLEFSLAGEEGRRSLHKHNLPGGSLDAHQVWACHNRAVYTSMALGAWGLRCSPHTLLMAICGHYSPPMSHTHASECSLCSSRATAVGISATLYCHHRRRCLLLLLTVAVVIDVYSLILPPQTHHTDPPVRLQSCKALFICQQDGWDTHTHTHMPNMDSLMEDPLMLFLLTEYILFILVQSPALTPHLFYSAPSISLCLSALSLVYQPVSEPSCGLDHCG